MAAMSAFFVFSIIVLVVAIIYIIFEKAIPKHNKTQNSNTTNNPYDRFMEIWVTESQLQNKEDFPIKHPERDSTLTLQLDPRMQNASWVRLVGAVANGKGNLLVRVRVKDTENSIDP